MIVTEMQMIEKRREFLAMRGLTIQSAFDLSLKEKKQLSGEFIEWLRKIGVTNGDDPHWRATPIGAAAR